MSFFPLICSPFPLVRRGNGGVDVVGTEDGRKIVIDRLAQLSSSRLMPTGPSPPGNPHRPRGPIERLHVGHHIKWGLHEGVACLFRNENGSSHRMGLRHNEHAVGARRMRNYLIQPYPDSQVRAQRGDAAPHVLVHYFDSRANVCKKGLWERQYYKI